MIKKLLLIFFAFTTTLAAAAKPTFQELVAPYELPNDHPAKKNLDRIFSKTRATSSIAAMKKAGFILRPSRNEQRMVVAKHPFIGNYIVKAYLDTQLRMPAEWRHWIQRINGAQLIQKSIDEHGYN